MTMNIMKVINFYYLYAISRMKISLIDFRNICLSQWQVCLLKNMKNLIVDIIIYNSSFRK